MKIANHKNEKLFKELKTGDVFMENGECYMKTCETRDNDEYYNAVYLKDGSHEFFMESMKVLEVDCELVIK